MAENKISPLGANSEDSRDNRLDVVGDRGGTTTWRIRGIPTHVRDMANEVAKKQDMKLCDFLAEAILRHVEDLEETADTETDVDVSIAKKLEECVARIESLENRLTTLEAPKTYGTKLKAHSWVKNIVERPWLKDSQ